MFPLILPLQCFREKRTKYRYIQWRLELKWQNNLSGVGLWAGPKFSTAAKISLGFFSAVAKIGQLKKCKLQSDFANDIRSYNNLYTTLREQTWKQWKKKQAAAKMSAYAGFKRRLETTSFVIKFRTFFLKMEKIEKNLVKTLDFYPICSLLKPTSHQPVGWDELCRRLSRLT